MQSQIIDFTNAFEKEDITSRDPVFIEIPRYSESDKEKFDAVLRLNKSLDGKSEASRLWYERLLNNLLDSGIVTIKVDPSSFLTTLSVFYIWMVVSFGHVHNMILILP